MREILKSTSRSFYLSLRFLPAATREQIGLAYLLARAADTIADTRSVPVDERLDWLDAFRERLRDPGRKRILGVRDSLGEQGQTEGERRLIGRMAELFRAFDRLAPGDRERTARVLEVIVEGMILERTWFPGESAAALRAIPSAEDLDRYCFHVAGVVGEYWTAMHAAHLPSLRNKARKMKPLGVRFGKGLQMVNVLRDIPADLRRGRCYLPSPDLERLGIRPAELLDAGSLVRVRPLLTELIKRAFSDLQAGWQYVLSIPTTQPRLRLCCAWPLLIGLRTLGLLDRSENPLDPGTIQKISRTEVYWLVAESTLRCWSNTALDVLWHRLARRWA